MVNIPVVAVALIAGFSLVPESRDPALGRFDLAGALLSVGSISLLVLAVIEAPVRGWTDVGTVLAFAGVIVLLAGFIFWESRRQSPLLDARFFRNARFSAASAISLAFFGFIFVIALYFQLIRGYSTLHAGLATLPFALVMGALSPVAILLIKKIVQEGGPGHQRGQRQPTGRGAGQLLWFRRVTGVPAPAAARIRRRDRPGHGQLRRADRVLRGLSLPRRRLRRILRRAHDGLEVARWSSAAK
jgi:hypothetical protein